MTSVMRFVSSAQHSKSASMAAQAARASAALAYVEPTIVLPLVIGRFQQAVETVRGRNCARVWRLEKLSLMPC